MVDPKDEWKKAQADWDARRDTAQGLPPSNSTYEPPDRLAQALGAAPPPPSGSLEREYSHYRWARGQQEGATVADKAGAQFRGGERPPENKTVSESLAKPERPGTKTLDYIALGLLLAPPAVVFEMYIKGESINWPRTTIATVVSWVVGAIFVSASHGWQSWRSTDWRIWPYLGAAEKTFWGKALIVAAAMGGALALSSLLSNSPTLPTPPIAQAPPTPIEPTKPFYSAAQKEELANRIATIYQLMNTNMIDIANGWLTVASQNLTGMSKQDVGQLLTVIDGLQHQTLDLNDQLWIKAVNGNPNFKDELRELIGGDNAPISRLETAIQNFTNGVSVYWQIYDALKEPPVVRGEYVQLLYPFYIALQESCRDLQKWVDQSNARIEERRKSL